VSTEPTNRHPASIRDVARIAGVSRQTVSRVINSHPSLRPETRDRVLAVIDQLQYRPNRAAQALGTNRSQAIGVLALQRSQYGPAAAIQGIERAAQAAGYVVNTTNLTSNTPGAINEALELQLAHRVDGLVIIAPQTKILRAIDELDLDVPYVMLHSRDHDDPHALFVDQLAGASAATRHLIALGHRDIYHLAGPQEWIEAEARMQGFLDAMIDADMPVAAPILGDWTSDFGYYAGRELVRTCDFTAVFAANDQMALGLIHAFRDAGLDVPGDVSVVGFDDVPEAAHYWPPLTTVQQDFEELGRLCVARLLRMSDPKVAELGAPIAPRLVIRGSTARVRRLPLRTTITKP
jgi:DNA-binding LacI/PurR family transcriptional regulator